MFRKIKCLFGFHKPKLTWEMDVWSGCIYSRCVYCDKLFLVYKPKIIRK